MKAVKVPVASDKPVEVIDVGKRRGVDWVDLVEAIGGPCRYIEKVNCVLTPEHNLVLVVDEDGLHDGQPLNPRAQNLFPFQPIVGDVLVMRMDYVIDGMDFVDLRDPEDALELVRGVVG